MFVLTRLLEELGIEHRVIGDRPTEFDHFGPIEEATPDTLVYIRTPDGTTADKINASVGRVFLFPRAWGEANLDRLRRPDATLVLVAEPRAAVAAMLRVMHPDEDSWPPGIHPTAIVDPGARLGAAPSIGPYAIVGKATIGGDCRIGAHTVIKDQVTIGDRVTIREHCLVGGAGFGFVRDEMGKLSRVPHVGRVVIEDDVEIFPYTNVDRGTIIETRVKRGTKIDHYAHIGHNSVVGEDCVITAGVVFCGKARIGDRSWAGVGSIVKEGVNVGSDVTVGLGTVILADVEDKATVVGVPGRVLKKG
jgi:UDP-3-O-[3-hydroxymyristoyl] glucosamine N-acyltransferase